MTTDAKALVIGAATRLGATLLGKLVEQGTPVLATDFSSRINMLKDLCGALDPGGSIIQSAALPIGSNREWLTPTIKEALSGHNVRIFHLVHSRNRTRATHEIRDRNILSCKQTLSLARQTKKLESVTVVTDVGLIGDYRGRFSENWLEVGQIPFDEVDRSSLEVEAMCLSEKQLPIIRARVGLPSDPQDLPHIHKLMHPAAKVVVPTMEALKRLPRFISIPSSIANGSLAPLSPTDWVARVLVHFSGLSEAAGKAFHLVIDSPPTMEEILKHISQKYDGARLRGGLPILPILRKFGIIPGMKEFSRRQADQLASWWSPHRYCLTHNELDTTLLRKYLPEELRQPEWKDLKSSYFRFF
jgi:nucleoside-diphosphate-sugar epimerase